MRLSAILRAMPPSEAAKRMQKVVGSNDRWMVAGGFILGLAGVLKLTGNLSRRFFAELILKPSDVQAIESPHQRPTIIAIPNTIPVHVVPQQMHKHTEQPLSELSRAPGQPIPSGSSKQEK